MGKHKKPPDSAFLAIFNDQTDKFKAILEQGVDVNFQEAEEGNTLLHLAAGHGRVEMVSLLIKAGADVNLTNDDGMTALMWAFRTAPGTGDVFKVLEVLLENGGNVNGRDKSDRTPLMYLAESTLWIKFLGMDPKPFIATLIDAGADLNAVDNKGCTALSIAQANINGEAVVQVLEGLGAAKGSASQPPGMEDGLEEGFSWPLEHESELIVTSDPFPVFKGGVCTIEAKFTLGYGVEDDPSVPKLLAESKVECRAICPKQTGSWQEMTQLETDEDMYWLLLESNLKIPSKATEIHFRVSSPGMEKVYELTDWKI